MKKLLLGVALLGSFSYNTLAQKVGSLHVDVVANMLDSTSNYVLIIEPTISASNDESYLLFNHGQVLTNQTDILLGKFKAMVIERDTGNIVPLKEANDENAEGMYVALEVDNKQFGKGEETLGHEVIKDSSGALTPSNLYYSLTRNSGIYSDIYNGEVLSKLITGTATGSFIYKQGNIVVKVNNITP